MKNCVILLNWNGWADTIECLESIFRLENSGFCVIVCDNASTDESLARIKEWAEGTLQAQSVNPALAHLISPVVSKPIPYRELTREQSETFPGLSDVPLTLIKNGANLGFAGGNNIGLRFALRATESRFFWLLNNDTVIAPDSLSAMVRLMISHPRMGLCGSLTLYYDPADEVQVQGGFRYNRWTARVPTPPRLNVSELPQSAVAFDYINGASMLASREFLESVGLMEESYFLYFEEIDWATRAKGKFDLGYSPQSVVYHKAGASIGSSSNRTQRSINSDKYLSSSRVLFTKRFFPFALPGVVLAVVLASAQRLFRGDLVRAKTMIAAMWGALWS